METTPTDGTKQPTASPNRPNPSDLVAAEIFVAYSNIGEEWIAEAIADNGEFRLHATSQTRAGALHQLADELEEWKP